MAQVLRFSLAGQECQWSWKQRGHTANDVLDETELRPDLDFVKGWRKAESSIPSEVHVELLKIGAIPEPYIGFNEHKVQCECQYHISLDIH